MFNDEQLDSIKISSTWKKERFVRDNGCQTKELDVAEVACQAIKRKSKEAQTEGATLLVAESQQDESPELLNWLKKVEPHIHKELAHGSRSHAFDDYDVSWEEQTNVISNIHTLSNDDVVEELQATGLSWNCTGAVIAASFGRMDHEDWCAHKGALCTWNLDRRQLEVNKPDTTVDLSSCLMCLQFHPTNPAMVAGGTFTGEVMIWDLSKEEDSLVASSGIGDDSHREPVSKVNWIEDTGSKTGSRYNVLSVSSDGKMLIWRVSSRKNTIKLVDGFVLLTASLPQSMRVRRGDQEMGVTCTALTKDDSATFLVGSESGGIFKCSTHSNVTATGSSAVSSVPLKSPVTFTFTPHNGPVYGLDCSPFHRNMFLTCGTDTTARLYSLLQAEPLLTLEPGHSYLYSTHWSPARPMVFAVGTEQGSLLIYDLKYNQGTPRYKLETAEAKQRHPLYTVQFNHRRPNLIATGDAKGYIRIWELNNELSQQVPREVEQLEELADISVD